MTPRNFLTHVVCLLIGIAGTVVVLKSGKNTHQSGSEDSHRTHAPRRNRPDVSQSPENRRKESARQMLVNLPDGENSSEREKWMNELSTSQFPLLIEALCQDIGPNGLAYLEKNLIEKTLEQWLKENPDECVVWINQLPAGAIKRDILKTLLGKMLESDPERALAMSETYGMEDSKWDHERTRFSFTSRRISKAWKNPDVTAEEMLALFAELPRENGSSGSPIKNYPENFDFRAFLDGVAAWNKADRKQTGTMPSNVLEHWARLDPSAAAQWFLQITEDQISVPFQDWEDIANAVIATSGEESYQQWTADLLTDVTEKQLNSIIREIEKRDMVKIPNGIHDIPQRDKVLQLMANQAGNQDRPQALALYAEISTPQARLAAIEKQPGYFRYWMKEKSLTPADWQQLGLTEAQVRATLGQ